MKTHFEKITKKFYAFLLWDESWNSYNNCYLLIEENDVILIDSGKEEHFEYLEAALDRVGIDKSNITQFFATHGHKDHIGGVNYLENATGYIHNNDLEFVPEKLVNKLTPTLPNKGLIDNFECILLGHHTAGSVALYHPETKALFCGDHICFFGDPLKNDVVEESESFRDNIKEFIFEWSKDEEMKNKNNFDLFMEGLNAIKDINAEYLCTGHGVILKGNIREFIAELLSYE